MEAVPRQGLLAWDVRREAGLASDFHARDPLARPAREVWLLDATRPALVLGSTQPATVADEAACRRAGVEIVRRRSGGGAVLLTPGDVLWVDVIVPAGDPLWDDDVSRSFLWLGAAWAAAVGGDVYPGPLRTTRWSSLICFAGLGSGEVTVGGRKVVGISQRRTRRGARFQCALLSRWDPDALVGLLASPRPAAGELAAVAAGSSVALAVATDAFLAALP